jgi:hypothetical protein
VSSEKIYVVSDDDDDEEEEEQQEEQEEEEEEEEFFNPKTIFFPARHHMYQYELIQKVSTSSLISMIVSHSGRCSFVLAILYTYEGFGGGACANSNTVDVLFSCFIKYVMKSKAAQ